MHTPPAEGLHDALGAFKQHALPFVDGVIQHNGRIGDVRTEDFPIRQIIAQNFFGVQRFAAINLFDDFIFFRHKRSQLSGKFIRIQQIGDAYPIARCLVHVARTDPLQRRADFVVPFALFFQAVENDMIRHDQMGAVADAQVVRAEPVFMNILDLVDQRLRVDDHAVSQDADFIGIKNAGRYQMQLVFLVIDQYGVSCVVSTLIPGYHFGVLRQKIGDFAFPFVSPLGTDYNNR
jgi:hypothetical protein